MPKSYVKRVLELLGDHFYDSEEQNALEVLAEAVRGEEELVQRRILRKFLEQAKSVWLTDLHEAKVYNDKGWIADAKQRIKEVDELLK